MGLRDTCGTNLIEAAILTPLLLLLTFAIAEFGSLFYVYLSLESGVSQATRYAVTGRSRAGQTREQSIKWAMRHSTPTLTIPDGAFTFSHMKPGTSAWEGGSGGASDIGKVTVRYNWEFMTPLIRPFFDSGRITLVVESAMQNEGFE
jgi:hypothetical protein